MHPLLTLLLIALAYGLIAATTITITETIFNRLHRSHS